MNNLIKFIIVLLIMTLTSCIESPWTAIKYINEKTHEKTKYYKLPKYKDFEDSYINGTFTNVYMKRWGGYNGESTYHLDILFKSDKPNTKVIINSIELVNSKSETYHSFTRKKLPVRLDLIEMSKKAIFGKQLYYNKYEPGDFFRTDSNKVHVSINITVISDNFSKTGDIKYTFNPILIKSRHRFLM